MSDDDLSQALTSGAAQTPEQIQAIVAQLRNRGQLGQLAAMSGDPSLAPFGKQILAENQQDQDQIGRMQLSNRSDDIRNAQIARQQQQGDSALAETIRYHNMEDQERKDKLTQQAQAIGDPTQFQSIVDKIGNYELPAPTLSRSPRNSAILDALSQQYPDYDNTKYVAKQKAQKDFATGPQGNMVRSAPVSIQHLDLADQKADLLHSSNVPIWNSIVNTVGPALGNTTIAKGVAGLDTAKTIVGDEIDKFFINGGGAEKDRQALQSKLANANAPSTIHEVTDTLRQLMAGQMNGLRSQYEDNVPGGDFIRDKVKSKAVLDSLGWDGSRFTGVRQATQSQQQSALPGATAALGGPPAQGSGPPQGPAPGGSSALPMATASNAPGAPPGAISPAEANLRQATGALGNGSAAPSNALVDNKGIVRTGSKMVNGKRIRVGQLADGTVIPLE